jgi:hypothetical protein
MLLALVLFFDNRKLKDVNVVPSDVSPLRRRNYVWYALTGYGIGLVAALAAGILSQSPQPALLYLVSVVRLYSQVLDLDVIAFFFHSAKLCFSDLATCFMVYQSFKLWWICIAWWLLFILTVCGFQVPSTLGPVMYLSWLRNELWELWEGSGTILNEKARLLEV